MKSFSFLVLLFLFHVTAGAKTITASGQCITGIVEGKTALTKHDAASQNTTIETRMLKEQKAEIVATIATKRTITLSKNLIYNI